MPSELPAALALVAHVEVEEEAYGDHLSSREAAHLRGLANPGVRRRWLAGRLAAKNLLLRGDAGETGLATLDGPRLRAFPAASYREIELLPDAVSGPPRLTWHGRNGRDDRDGREPAPQVSITHGAAISCAALASPGAAAGLDLEMVEPRIPAFYRGNFTPRERSWAEAGARSTALPAAWLYTLLWTLKEAALKSGATAVRSVWGFAGLEICLSADLPERLAASRRRGLGERFASFEAEAVAADRRTRARVETTSTPEAILSLFISLEASP
jgi:phosphopantetheinyl transferase (holo-ACP synthase)